MQYYVVSPDGSKYGPATVATLNEWAAQNRLQHTSIVEQAGTGQRMSAAQIPGINFATAPPTEQQGYASPPTMANYPRGYMPTAAVPGTQNMTNAWICFGLSFACCGLINIGTIIFANRAMEEGHPTANTARILGWVFLCINILVVVGYIIFFASLAASGQLR
jgi:hypothetical protein